MSTKVLSGRRKSGLGASAGLVAGSVAVTATHGTVRTALLIVLVTVVLLGVVVEARRGTASTVRVAVDLLVIALVVLAIYTSGSLPVLVAALVALVVWLAVPALLETRRDGRSTG
jgi:hypothetical protein